MDVLYFNAKEVQQMLGVSRSRAYEIIRHLNEELKGQGYFIINGKCSKRYFNEKFYGYDHAGQNQNPKGEM